MAPMAVEDDREYRPGRIASVGALSRSPAAGAS